MIVLLAGMALVAAAQTQPAAPAILQQAAHYQIIALGERHGVPAMEEFIEALVSDDEFGEQFDVLILENASAAHQNLIDRNVSGDDIPEDALAPVWRDAVNSLLAGGDNTHYARLLAAVRENNRDDVSPVRVIACDPAIDWANMDSAPAFWAAMSSRNAFCVDQIRSRALDTGDTALLLRGRSHLTHTRGNGDEAALGYQLDQSHPGASYIIHLLTDTAPALQALTRPSMDPMTVETAGEDSADRRSQFGGDATYQETIDAFLLLGPADEMNAAVSAGFSDPEYWTELERRAQLIYNASYRELAEQFGNPLPPTTD
ncbi:hypothetical protein [Maricaulis sp.]|uniref:hypothetical protein n=1 Tax=Maricaulis sp. TaxID=1486257 RepID=UPI001B1EEF7E|nr:hypothetical protein [Maricaulis sp.]MBO6796807.1 hypothetical protein [Maricaulis sp.]